MEPTNIKMARLRQSLTGTVLEAIRGHQEFHSQNTRKPRKFSSLNLVVSEESYKHYMDQIEEMPPLKSDHVQSLEQLADLVRIAVVRLQAEGRGGERGALHSLLVTKFADRQVESYSRLLREHEKDRSVLSLRDWLNEEVRS